MMIKSLKYLIKAVGYARISTDRQHDDGKALVHQADRIREACAEHQIDLLGIYDDVASSVGPHSAAKRPGLLDAFSHARAEGAILIVTDVTRLFRNPEVGFDFLKRAGVQVFSVAARKIVTLKDLRHGFEEGAVFADKARAGTMEGLARLAGDGKKLGSPAVHSLATKNSARSRQLRSDEIEDRLSYVLAEDLAYQALSHRAFAGLLNRRGIRTGWGREWTAGSVRRAHSGAMKVLREREALQGMVDLEDAPDFQNMDPNDLTGIAAKTITITASKADTLAPEESDLERIKSAAKYGQF